MRAGNCSSISNTLARSFRFTPPVHLLPPYRTRSPAHAVFLPRSSRRCYGVIPRLARTLPTPLMEYIVSQDPEDPVYYSTCYVREPKRLWIKPPWTQKPTPPMWRLNGQCLSCDSFDSAKVLNRSLGWVPQWQMSDRCEDCDAPGRLSLSAMEYDDPNAAADGGGAMAMTIGASAGGGFALVAGIAIAAVCFVRRRKIKTANSNAAKQGVEMGGRGRHVSNPLEMSRVQSMPPSNSMDRKSRLVAMEKAAAGYQLPDGWESAVDESTGDAYYFHGASGTTQWDFPE